jgi:5-methylcytosine-specific restriction protein A
MQTLKPRLQTLSTATARSQTQVTRIRGNSLYAIRRKHFEANHLCVECDRQGRVSRATELDHIIPLWAGGQESEANRAGLCHECHQAKTAEEAKQRASLGLAPLTEYTRQ